MHRVEMALHRVEMTLHRVEMTLHRVEMTLHRVEMTLHRVEMTLHLLLLEFPKSMYNEKADQNQKTAVAQSNEPKTQETAPPVSRTPLYDLTN